MAREVKLVKSIITVTIVCIANCVNLYSALASMLGTYTTTVK